MNEVTLHLTQAHAEALLSAGLLGVELMDAGNHSRWQGKIAQAEAALDALAEAVSVGRCSR